jgi:pimeloyl-ACP methyl ester carboxylesterase
VRYPPPGQLIDVGGFRLHLHCAGEGSPTVVLDAALGGSSVSWSWIQPEIAKTTRVCAYDRGGFGWSDAAPMPRTASRLADELRGLLARAGVRPPFVLVGHSFGGLVLRVFAQRYRTEIAGIVFVDSAHPEDWVNPADKERLQIDRGLLLCRRGAAASRFGAAHVVAVLGSLGAFTVARLIAKAVSLGNLSQEDEGILAPMWKLPAHARKPLRQFWTSEKFYAALGNQIEWIQHSAMEALEASKEGYGDLPLVTISCTNPGDYRIKQQDALARLSTCGRHIMASNSGHWIPLDEPEIVIDAIQDVISQHRRVHH